MNITADKEALRKIVPKAVITVSWTDKHVKWNCDLQHAKITPEEHDSYFAPIKEYFGDRLLERYSHHTGLFDVYVRIVNPQNN